MAVVARSATAKRPNGVMAVSDSPQDPSGFAGGGDAWIYIEGADPVRLELAGRGAKHVLGVLQEWVGDQAGQLEWEYGWVISVEEREREWEVVVQGLTGDERVLSLLVPAAVTQTHELRLAVEAVCRAGSVLMLYAPADFEHPIGDRCDGALVGIIPERVENYGHHMRLVSASQRFGLLPEWWPTNVELPPIPTQS